jgi:hypothetical protein
MRRDQEPRAIAACPHLDGDDPRCAGHLSLGRLDLAFAVCHGAFHACRVFHQLTIETREAPVDSLVARHSSHVSVRPVAA